MNVGAFAVVIARERASEHGDDLAALENLGQAAVARLADDDLHALAGRCHRGVHRQVLLDRRRVAGDYTWLGIVIVVGSVVSLAYYEVIAVMWMGRYGI